MTGKHPTALGRGREFGGTRFLQKAGFPRTPSGKNSYMAGGATSARVETHCDYTDAF
jgi:hypothetical protein